MRGRVGQVRSRKRESEKLSTREKEEKEREKGNASDEEKRQLVHMRGFHEGSCV